MVIPGTPEVPFTKVDGAGNHFVLVDAMGANRALFEDLDWSRIAPLVCSEESGVFVDGLRGADGILIVTDPDNPSQAVASGHIVNPDGSDGVMCGNGFRCYAKYLVERKRIRPQDGKFAIETRAGLLTAQFLGWIPGDNEVDRIRVEMGEPRFSSDQIPVDHQGSPPILDHSINLDGVTYEVACVSMGNPHAVHFVDSLEELEAFPLADIGPKIEAHPDFPNRTNFEVIAVESPNRLRMRVWERGVGITKACGSGACAAHVAARLARRDTAPEPKVTVVLDGGQLDIEWRGSELDGQPVYMTGTAELGPVGVLNPVWLQPGLRLPNRELATVSQ